MTTNFDEEIYTTKLDRTAPDYKDRERKAQQIANEILGVSMGLPTFVQRALTIPDSQSSTSNPHIAEERNLANDDSGKNEEDK